MEKQADVVLGRRALASPVGDRAAFAEGWRVDSIEPVMIDSAEQRAAAHAWLAAITRT